jgi:hypothetical protein
MAAALLVVAACGGDGGSGDNTGGPVDETTSTTTTAAPQPAVPGQVEIAVDGITGGSTQILLTMIHGGNPERPLGVSCAQLDDDPWSYSGLVYPIEGDHPCALGTTPIEFEPGTYQAIFGVYTGGQRSPDQCVEVEFEVDGNTTVTAPAMVAPCDLGN